MSLLLSLKKTFEVFIKKFISTLNSFLFIIIFLKLVLCVLVLLNERRALGVALLAGTMIPAVDMSIVLGKSDNGVMQAMPRIIAVLIVLCSE
jgi:preprotein translocase subunit SecG